jgi:hypothetical protein
MTEKKVDESWKEKIEHEHEEQKKEQQQQKQQQKEAGPAQPEAEPKGFPPIQASFVTLLADLAMQASLFLGEIVDPETNEPLTDLNRAKYLIDELGILEQRTKGNLSPEESEALKNVLYDLRMKFVEKAPKR